ncbi:MAG: hypothetical protein J7619_12750 [Dyadobacter sp.]|uniref:hypothetical protein n=1 Tax=Dyadobacter sp. TaxID=1914288 RepID=UPI001B0140A6|nr:hypothetical protein [Dyadobacter sp.]MBO9613564.1 hypothetical protein [Dyadobacter sp.]
MTHYYRGVIRFVIFMFFSVALLPGCRRQYDEQERDSPKKKYSIYAMMKDGREYILQIDSISSGETNPEKSGARVMQAPLYYDLIVHEGRYCSVDRRTGSFVRHKIEDGEFVKDTAIAVTGFSSVKNYNWLSRDSLMILGYDDGAPKVRYGKIDVRNLSIIQGTVPIPAPFGPYNWLSIGFSQFLENKLYVGYCYHTYTLDNYTTGDTIYTAILDYPKKTITH